MYDASYLESVTDLMHWLSQYFAPRRDSTTLWSELVGKVASSLLWLQLLYGVS